MTDTHLLRSIRSLKSKLRRVPALQRRAHHQIAVRHIKLAELLVDRNEDAALEHFQTASLAAREANAIL